MSKATTSPSTPSTSPLNKPGRRITPSPPLPALSARGSSLLTIALIKPLGVPMNLGLVCPEASGHLNPSLVLASELARRGHRVRMICTPGATERIARVGLEQITVGQPEADAGLVERAMDHLGSQRGWRALAYTGRLIAEASRVLLRDLPPLLAADPCDALLVDQVSPGGAAVAEQLDIPYIVLCNALAVMLDESTPPITTTWRMSDARWAKARNNLVKACGAPLMDFLSGVQSPWESSMALCRGNDNSLTRIAQQPSGFDFPKREGPRALHYTGPWHHTVPGPADDFPWHRIDGRPLIYASLGTIQNRTPTLFRKIIESVRGDDVQLVLSLGRKQAHWNERVPENVIIVPFAPQLAILARSDLAITHAGLNTALECLAAGVPMLCLPITNDQPGVAARVEWVGAGRHLSPRAASPARLRALRQELLNNPSYRQVARAFQSEIAETPGATLAADLIERLLAPAAKPLTPTASAESKPASTSPQSPSPTTE